MVGRAELARGVRDVLDEAGIAPDTPLVVAVSGGMDSLALLHLLYFGEDGTGTTPLHRALHPAHFDHRMREESAEQARCLAEMVQGWGLSLHQGVAKDPPKSESEARRLRYTFLRRVRALVGATRIATAHHADDQRETVLFRVLRGTGVRGLRGMRAVAPPDLVRPLLDQSRSEIAAMGRAAGVIPLEDPSNRDLAHARNRIRHDILPRLDEVHPGASEGLLRLSRLAEQHDAALRALLEPHLHRLVERDMGFPPATATRYTLSREALLGFPEPVRGFLVREVVERVGVPLSEAGTAAALEFIRAGSSGGSIELAGGLVLVRDFDRLHLRTAPPAGPDLPDGEEGTTSVSDDFLEVADPGAPGSGVVGVGGERYHVWWGPPESGREGADRHEASPRRAVARFGSDGVRGPLHIRGRRPGDRADHHTGKRPVKKLMRELRIDRSRRNSLPLLVDATGLVTWIPGYWQSTRGKGESESEPWIIEVEHVDPER